MINEEDSDKDIFEYLLEVGAIEIQGYDSISDNFTYNLTQKCKELFPELWEEHFKHVNDLSFTLWQKGIVEMKFDENGPLVMIKDIENAKKIKDTLPEDERMFIENILHRYEIDYKDK